MATRVKDKVIVFLVNVSERLRVIEFVLDGLKIGANLLKLFRITGALAEAIDKTFGGVDGLKEKVNAAGAGRFGSGWAWLQVKGGKLEIAKTANGENPLVHGAVPILGVDVWEHSYYIDYRNRRPDYLKAFVDSLVNWDYVDELFGKAG